LPPIWQVRTKRVDEAGADETGFTLEAGTEEAGFEDSVTKIPLTVLFVFFASLWVFVCGVV
jgi:hypothetical protein